MQILLWAMFFISFYTFLSFVWGIMTLGRPHSNDTVDRWYDYMLCWPLFFIMTLKNLISRK